MDPIQCPKCRLTYTLGDEWAGKVFHCTCGNVVQAPERQSVVRWTQEAKPLSARVESVSPLAFDFEDTTQPIVVNYGRPVGRSTHAAKGRSPHVWFVAGMVAVVGCIVAAIFIVRAHDASKENAEMARTRIALAIIEHEGDVFRVQNEFWQNRNVSEIPRVNSWEWRRDGKPIAPVEHWGWRFKSLADLDPDADRAFRTLRSEIQQKFHPILANHHAAMMDEAKPFMQNMPEKKKRPMKFDDVDDLDDLDDLKDDFHGMPVDRAAIRELAAIHRKWVDLAAIQCNAEAARLRKKHVAAYMN